MKKFFKYLLTLFIVLSFYFLYVIGTKYYVNNFKYSQISNNEKEIVQNSNLDNSQINKPDLNQSKTIQDITINYDEDKILIDEDEEENDLSSVNNIIFDSKFFLNEFKNNPEMLEMMVENIIQRKIDTQKTSREENLMRIVNKFLPLLSICPYVEYSDSNFINHKQVAKIGLNINDENFSDENVVLLILKPNCLTSQELNLAVEKTILDNNLSMKVVYIYYSTLGHDADYISNLAMSIVQYAADKFALFNKYINTGQRNEIDLNNFLTKHKIKIPNEAIKNNYQKINQIKEAFFDLEYQDLPMLIKNGQIFMDDFSAKKINDILTDKE